jgi:quinol monooxygenase YgiN
MSPNLATIDPKAKLTTLVNIFTVAPENCGRLAALLREADTWISQVPGFLTSALHVSRDQQRIVIYGQWRSADGLGLMRQRPEMPASAAQTKALATLDTTVCDVSSALTTTVQPITIDPKAQLTTLVNTLTVAPENCERLVALLKEGTDSWICKIPGFMGAALHVSRDQRRVVIYGQWRSAEGIAAMRQSHYMPPYFERIKALAKMDEAITCDLASTLVV